MCARSAGVSPAVYRTKADIPAEKTPALRHRPIDSGTSAPESLTRNPDRQILVPLHEIRQNPHRFADHFDMVEAGEDFFPQDFQL